MAKLFARTRQCEKYHLRARHPSVASFWATVPAQLNAFKWSLVFISVLVKCNSNEIVNPFFFFVDSKGGNAPFIIFDSADIKKAIVGVMASKFRGSGQTCICANRILVQENVYDRFVEELAKEMNKQLRIGSGFEKETTQGPLINKLAVNKVSELVEDSKAKGAKVVLGGKRSDILSGNFYEPTLLTDVNLSMKIAREEIFGPIAAIIKY